MDYTFGKNSYYYLDKMVQLCKENDVELVLIKAPSLSPVWWDEWDAQIESYAQENSLRYYNFLEHQEEIGIDWNKDTYDTGLHLNVYGAEKMSRYFGKILSEDCGVKDRRNNAEICGDWAEKVQTYYDRKARLETAEDTTN